MLLLQTYSQDTFFVCDLYAILYNQNFTNSFMLPKTNKKLTTPNNPLTAR